MEAFFNKVYDLKNSGWSLPAEVYVEDKWVLEQMQSKKTMLNSVKSKLDKYDLSTWSLHTERRDASKPIMKAIHQIVQPELLTQAWCKFFEIVAKHPRIVPSVVDGTLRSLHLCEAPGGFISALNHYLCLYQPNIKLEWSANSLNPNYEGNPLNKMITDDRLIMHTRERWMFGADQTGDITKDYNYEDLTEKVLSSGRVHLVTADGSINCIDDAGNQEVQVEHLHYCETMTALRVLQIGGSFLLKIFTMFEESTICLLYLLTCCFASVRIFKPITSKSGNSETYVICLEYNGFDSLQTIWPRLMTSYKDATCRNKSMFRLEDVHPDFLRQVDDCAEFFKRKQMHIINDNVRNFEYNDDRYFEKVKLETLHQDITEHFFSIYQIGRIQSSKKLVPTRQVDRHRKPFQTNMQINCKRYTLKKRVPCVNLIVGKCIETVFYSKYTLSHLVSRKPRARSKKALNLINLTTAALVKSDQCVVVDYDTMHSSNQWEFECTLLKTISSNLGLDMVFINVPIRSTFLANIFYMLCNCFKLNYFFARGVIIFSGFEQTKEKEMVHELGKVRRFIEAESDVGDAVYRKGLIQIVDEMSTNFLKCVWFYNNNLWRKR